MIIYLFNRYCLSTHYRADMAMYEEYKREIIGIKLMGLMDIDVQIDKFSCVSEAMIEETGILLGHIGQAFNCNLCNLRGLPMNKYTWTKTPKIRIWGGK